MFASTCVCILAFALMSLILHVGMHGIFDRAPLKIHYCLTVCGDVIPKVLIILYKHIGVWVHGQKRLCGYICTGSPAVKCRTCNRERRYSNPLKYRFKAGVFSFYLRRPNSISWTLSLSRYRRKWKCEWVGFTRNNSLARMLPGEVELI